MKGSNMTRTSEQVKADIRQIDRRIDGIRLELYRRGGRFNTFDCGAWQLAWDRNPDLRARETALYSTRYDFSQEENAALTSEHRAEQRRCRAANRKATREFCRAA